MNTCSYNVRIVNDLVSYLYWITLSAEGLLGAGLLLSILRPEYRIWPPPKKESWQFWFVWLLFALAVLGLVVFVLQDWNSFVFPNWLRYAVGLPTLVSGLVLAFWGSGILGWKRTSGQKGQLKTDGLYRYSRNPQYLGDIMNFVGLILVSNSALALIPGLLAATLFFLWPFSEEPWLRERFGAAYERYCQQVPRFF